MKATNKNLHILFIDDEENLLNGLQRMLRSKKSDWKSSFVVGGEAACNFLLENHVDIIVTDMKMPNCDGEQLLNFALENNPHCVRIVLSGQADEDKINKVVHMTHQFISKPCDVNQLIERIEQVCNTLTVIGQIEEIQNSEELNQIYKSSFPCQAEILAELKKQLEEKRKVDDEITSLVLQDIGITARIIQISCSGFYINHSNYLNIKQALEALGVDRLLKLINSTEVFGSISQEESVAFKGFYQHFSSKQADWLRENLSYLNNNNKNYELQTLFVLSHSAFLIFPELKTIDCIKLHKYSFLLCSLWGIPIGQWINLHEEVKTLPAYC